MSFIEPSAATVSVQTLIAFNDAELAQFMEKHRHPNGDFQLPVDGWDRITKEEQDSLAERLKTQQRALAENPTMHSHVLDLEQLDARLGEVAANNNTPTWSRARNHERSHPPTPFFDFEADARELEMEAYDNLVKDGGRPLYQIGLLEDVSKNPDKYCEMLRPWQNRLDTMKSWFVFQRQWKSWDDFRKWQRDNRGLEDDDGGFPGYVERLRRLWEKDGYTSGLEDIRADPSRLKSGWELRQLLRQRQRRNHREHDCDGFSDYVEAARRRLARHDCNLPFDLKEDPKKQDKLTTWVEYLNFEYWWLDKHNEYVERHRPHHDKAWQEILDSKLLQSHETLEYIRTFQCTLRHGADEQRAREDVKTAMSEAEEVYKTTQLDSHRLEIPTPERRRMLRAATEQLNEAHARQRWVKRRNELVTDFVNGTYHYDRQKKSADRQINVVSWILGQLPLIEAELIQPEMIDTEPHLTRNRKRTMTFDECRDPKRQKQVGGDALLPVSSTAVLSAKEEVDVPSFFADDGNRSTQRGEASGQRTRQSPVRHSLQSEIGSRAMSQGPRRSARIAARQDKPSPALAAPLSRRQLRSRLRAKPAVTATHPPSIRGTSSRAASHKSAKDGRRQHVSKGKEKSRTARRSLRKAT
ncbi:hypothetical protein HIM_03888 [Hirsutella minnesotensis 3608]|uniref:Ankyrin 2,3/unc44 n=1 Tax=Hirsutella minnesotensis 3608 TaxID=1043627 RepID=A0A0F8A1W4_9HYPO|nr:hypothetical protein HIM_03888 [Hirsutella minnesotensis 3608]